MDCGGMNVFGGKMCCGGGIIGGGGCGGINGGGFIAGGVTIAIDAGMTAGPDFELDGPCPSGTHQTRPCSSAFRS